MDGRRWAVEVPDGYRVGAWEVCGRIACGSWSSVYEARPAAGGEDRVALKFVPTGTLTPRRLGHLAEMARRELALYDRLSHPRLIRLLETHTVDDPGHPELDGATVLVMERAAGSLGALLRRGGGGPVPDAPRLLIEICEGLEHLHTSGWVHGDLKPGNILIMADGSARLADFGLAAELDGTHAYMPPIGTPDYVAPERRNEPVGEQGAAVRTTADIWALGVMAHQVLTGRLPFTGSTERARRAEVEAFAAGRGELALSPALSPPWHKLIEDCLAAEHRRRGRHDAANLLARLRALAGTPATVEEAQGRLKRRTRRVVIMTVCGAAMVGAVPSVVALSDGGRPEPARTPATGHSRYLRTGTDIPPEYYDLIVRAGTMCQERGLSPALIAAMLKAESNFDSNLKDPDMDEYGIARWTPRVLRYHLPPDRRDRAAEAAMRPEESIPAMGGFFCRYGSELADVPGDPALNLAAAYRTSITTVVRAGGIPARVRPYIGQVRVHMARYRPQAAAVPDAPRGRG
jgi:serine/threonine protein kinase